MSPNGPTNFATTRWSIVQAARRHSSSTSRIALEELCATYWPPVYAFIRHGGYSPADAEDLTQAFFLHLLDSDFVESADPDRGRFRSYLLKSVSNYLRDAKRTANAQKRGGGRKVLSLDLSEGEQHYLTEPAEISTAEQLFERRWALTLLNKTMQLLRDEYTARNHCLLFESLEAHINADAARVPYAELTETLSMTEDAIKQAARRLKLRYRELLRTEIANTVNSPDDIDDELRQLLTALS